MPCIVFCIVHKEELDNFHFFYQMLVRLGDGAGWDGRGKQQAWGDEKVRGHA
jgi:hypothetical protein